MIVNRIGRILVHNGRRVNFSARCLSSIATDPFAAYEMAPLDPIIGLTEQYNRDDFIDKVNVGVGAYRDDSGKPYVLSCVREAERRLLAANHDMEYSGIAGDQSFIDVSLKFAYGEESDAFKEGRIKGVQALSGTGGLRVFGELIRKHGHKHIYVPNPTWGNHNAIFNNSGLEVRKYRYYDSFTSKIEFDNMIKDFNEMPEGSCVLLHVCAHNPTGMDPTLEQWKVISETFKKKKLFPFFDNAYQGFASGSAAKDAAPLRLFVDDGHLLALVQSFSKNFGLYGHRIGTLSVVAATPDEANRVVSQMKLVIRPMYSNPPRHGARIVTEVLSDEQLTKDWEKECRDMSKRIHAMRTALRNSLEHLGSKRSWQHIVDQIGMFAYSGLSKEQVKKLREKHHIYCTMDGRISMAGVTSLNVNYMADAIYDVAG